MNRKRKLKQMRRFINRYGYIEHEYRRPPEKGFYPYRKGSFFVSFYSNELGLSGAYGDCSQYEVHKMICSDIRRFLKTEGVKREALDR